MIHHKIAINHATVREKWNMREFVEGCLRHDIQAIAVWQDKIDEIGIVEAKKLIKTHDLKVTGYNRIGPFLSDEKRDRQCKLDDARRGIDQAVELAAECVFVFPGGLIPGSKSVTDANTQTVDTIAELLPYASNAGIPLALEPLHPMIAADRSLLNTMRQANAICDRLGEGIGIIVDVYHVWWDDTLGEEIMRAGKDRLLGFQVSDWLVPTKDLLSDRGMMGDGVIDLKTIRSQMEAAGFEGFNEVELFSNYWWSQDPDDVLRVSIKRCQAHL